MKSTMLAAVICLAAASISSTGYCKLIEDGASFTGTYKVQEDKCKAEAFDYTTGKKFLVDNIVFEGTPYGLKVNGQMMPLQPMTTFDHGGGLVTGESAEYLSSNEMLEAVLEISPAINQGQKTLISYDYVIDSYGNITKTTTTTIGTRPAAVTEICHYTRF